LGRTAGSALLGGEALEIDSAAFGATTTPETVERVKSLVPGERVPAQPLLRRRRLTGVIAKL
jgi:hypothetical protein